MKPNQKKNPPFDDSFVAKTHVADSVRRASCCIDCHTLVFRCRVVGRCTWLLRVELLPIRTGARRCRFEFSSNTDAISQSASAIFFSRPIDTWPRWCGIVVYVVVQQLVSTYSLETISPWMMNQLQNRRVRTLREGEATSLVIVSTWYLYMWLSRVVSIQILLLQIDFLLLVLVVDLLTTFVVTKVYYLSDKRTGLCKHTCVLQASAHTH